MKITADTNVLVRLIMADDEAQSRMAAEAMESAELVAISVVSLCEFARVLERGYKAARSDIATAIRGVLGMRNVELDRPAVDAGLRVLEAGGDFADGVIAYDGRWLGGECLVSFDERAVSRLSALGEPARLLSWQLPALTA